MNELLKRVIVAIIGIPLAIFIIYMGGLPFAALVVLISSLALWEYYRIAEKKGSFPLKTIGVVFNIVLLLVFFLFLIQGRIIEGGVYIISIIILEVLIILAVEMWSGNQNSIYNSAVTITGIFYITLSFCFLIAIREIYRFPAYEFLAYNKQTLLGLLDRMTSGFLVMSIFFSVWICDTAAYFTGRAIGRHKLFPRVSPKKTWEGAIGGLIGGIVSSILFTRFLIPGFPIFHAAVIGGIIGTAGQIGDLAESLLKRDAGVKDSSSLLPGHGGALDRFDSILFVVPVIFIYIILFV